MNKTKFFNLKKGAKLVYQSFPYGGNATGIFCGFFCGAASTKNGMPHLVEHCLLEGTTRHNHEELNNLTNNYGYFMPITYEDVMGVLIYCSNRQLAEVLGLAKEVLLDCTFPSEAIKKQTGIVKQEREQRKNKIMSNIRSMHHFFITKKFANVDEYGTYWIGSDEFLDSVSHDDMMKFKEDNFVANKFIMFASSTLPAGRIKKLYNDVFLPSLAMSEQPAFRPERDSITQTPSVEVIPKTASVVEIMLSIKDPGPYSKEYVFFNYDRDFVGYAAETQVSSIMHRLRDAGYSYDPNIYFSSYDDAFTFNVSLTTTSAENIEPIFKIIGECIADFKASGVSQELIDQYKERFRTSQDMPHGLKNNCSKVEDMIFRYHHHQENDLENGVSDKQIVKYCEKSTQQSIKQAIDRMFDPKNDMFVTFGGMLKKDEVKDISFYKNLIFPNA